MKRFLAPITDLFRSSTQGIFKFNYELLNASTQFNTYYKDREKLTAALTNPALLKVIALQCDMFSIGEVYIKDKSGKYIESDPFLDWIKNPNPLQSQKQFLWDYMFWEMLGNAYLYIDSKIIDRQNNYAYFMQPEKIDFPAWMQLEADKFIFSNSKLSRLMNQNIKYYYDDGTHFTFQLGKLLISHDLTNGVGNLFKGASKIDALFKIISNSEYSLDSKNINVRYAGKFMVGSDKTEQSVGITKEEKDSINESMNKDQKQVYPMSSKVNIQRFVEDLAKLQLDQSYLADYFLIGNMYNIPRDVLEAYQSSTYENQEKSRGSHVSYTLQPKADEFCGQLAKYFGYDKDGRQICMDWSYLPFMQVFENDKANTVRLKVEAMEKLIAMGQSFESAKKLVDLE